MKEKSLDEKVYEALCAKFDQIVNEHTWASLFKTMYDSGVRYAEDLAKCTPDKIAFCAALFCMKDYFHPQSKVFEDMKYEVIREGYEHYEYDEIGRVIKVTDIPDEYAYVYYLKVDTFQCSFPIERLPDYLAKFKQLSHHRGKHEIDYSMSPAYESIYALQTA